MHLQLAILFPLVMACVASGSPIHQGQGRGELVQPRGAGDTSSTSEVVSTSLENSLPLEEQSGPYEFAPAPVWRRDTADDPSTESLPLEQQAGPHHFASAPVWPEHSALQSPPDLSPLEEEADPYHSASIPVERRDGAPGPPTDSPPLEEQPGPYHFDPAPVWTSSASKFADA